MVPNGRSRLFFVLTLGLVGIACSAAVAGHPIARAYCNACGAKAFTQSDCDAFGKAAGCLTSTLDDATMDECRNSCSFEHCVQSVQCSAPVDPQCSNGSFDGTFPSIAEAPPTCSPLEVDQPDGQKAIACSCDGGCPCNWLCGSGEPLTSSFICHPVIYD